MNQTASPSAGSKLRPVAQSSPISRNGLYSNTKKLSWPATGRTPHTFPPCFTATCSATEKHSGRTKCQLQHAEVCVQALKDISALVPVAPCSPFFLPQLQLLGPSFLAALPPGYCIPVATLIHASSILPHQVPAVARSSHMTSALAPTCYDSLLTNYLPFAAFLPCPFCCHRLSPSASGFDVLSLGCVF